MEKDTNPKDAVATNKLPTHLVSGIVKAYQSIAHFLGNVKYGAWNYRGAGVRLSVYKSALDRHVDAWWEGEEDDPTDGTPHLANAQACLNIIIEAKHSGKMIDDRPPSRAAELAKLRAKFEALMPVIRERYKDKNPYHYTIADSAGTEPAADAATPDHVPTPLPVIERRAPRPGDVKLMLDAASLLDKPVFDDEARAMRIRLRAAAREGAQ